MDDPNTLLSTLSQSAAAMVGIIGGFLVSRLVALSSEREGVVRQLKAAQQRLDLHRAEYKPAHEYRLQNSITTMEDWLLDELIEERAESKSKATPDLVQVPRGSSLEEMLPYAEKIRARVEDAFDEVLSLLKQGDNDLLTFDDLIERGLKFADQDRDLFDRVASFVIGELPPGGFNSLGGVHSAILAGFKPAWSHEVESRRLDESIRNESELHALMVADDHEVKRLTEELDSFAQPVGVTAAIWILTIFSIVGIMMPLLLMAFWSRPIPKDVIIFQIVSFGVGLAAVLAYIGWYKDEISRKPTIGASNRDNAPETHDT